MASSIFELQQKLTEQQLLNAKVVIISFIVEAAARDHGVEAQIDQPRETTNKSE